MMTVHCMLLYTQSQLILHILSTGDRETKTVVAQRGEIDLLDDRLQHMDGVFNLGDLRLVDLESGSSIGVSETGISKTEGVSSIGQGCGGGGGSGLLLISITPLSGTGHGDTGNVVTSEAKAVGVAVETGISKSMSVVTGISGVQDGGISLGVGITLLSGLTLGQTGDGESKDVLASGFGNTVLDGGDWHLDFLSHSLDHLGGVRVGERVGSITIRVAKILTVDSKH